jgi:hypothetical protein
MLVKQVQEAYQAGELYWPADLMVELEKRRPGRTLEWAIECMKALLENDPPVDKEKQLRWLSELSSARPNPVVAELRDKSLEIWHEKRDQFHTAISHLYAALVYLAWGEDRQYRTTVLMALRVMGDHPFYRQTSVAIPLALFEQFVAKPA